VPSGDQAGVLAVPGPVVSATGSPPLAATDRTSATRPLERTNAIEPFAAEATSARSRDPPTPASAVASSSRPATATAAMATDLVLLVTNLRASSCGRPTIPPQRPRALGLSRASSRGFGLGGTGLA
jgi:hypothetical protein